MKRTSPHILLINPWVTDFAAYNFWIKPLGLLNIASRLRKNGFQVAFIDCLDLHSKKKKYGDGNFFKTWIEKPGPLKSIPRYYSQYGIPEEALLEKLSSLDKPDAIGVTSGMTYWYPGVFKVIEIAKRFFKDVPVVLGGIYATLCQDHARKHSGADFIIQGRGELEGLRLISELAHFDIPPSAIPHPHSTATMNSLPVRQAGRLRTHDYPAFDLYPKLDFICIATSKGCPLKCTYCASHLLYNGFDQRDPEEVVQEIEYWVTRYKINNIAFYDDALLIKPRDHIIPILREMIKRGVECNLHTPNGLHIKEIDEELAALFFMAGFKTLRLGFETSHEAAQRDTGGKVGNEEFVRTVRNLKRAGYPGDEIGVYVMAGLPGQRVGEAEESIAFVQGAGARPILVEYSPIPNTPLFEKAKQMSQFDIEGEPLYQNNSILPCQWEGFTMVDYRRLKEKIRRR
jgi:radical SAM superfamily enzyme YgiQ (UPF0313 family)